MSTTLDLPASALLMGNPSANGPYSGGFDAGGREEELTWAVPFEDRFAFEEAVVGYPETITVGTTTITRRVSLKSPYNPNLIALRARFKSQGKANTNASRPYNTILYSITFGIPPWGAEGDTPYQTLQETGASRSITDPSRRYVFVGNGQPVDQGVAVTYSGTSFQFTQYGMNKATLQAFREAILPLLATPVNSAPLTVAGITFPAGTILMETYSVQSSSSLFGIFEASASITLNYSALPWNSYMRSDGNIDVLSPQPYQTADLASFIY